MKPQKSKRCKERGFKAGLMDWWSKGPGENGGISAASIRRCDWKILNLTVQPHISGS